MTTLAIAKVPGEYRLYTTDEANLHAPWRLVAQIPFGTLSSRPDPITRAWQAVEAKRALYGVPRCSRTSSPSPTSSSWSPAGCLPS